jgi:hypothetical protein
MKQEVEGVMRVVAVENDDGVAAESIRLGTVGMSSLGRGGEHARAVMLSLTVVRAPFTVCEMLGSQSGSSQLRCGNPCMWKGTL